MQISQFFVNGDIKGAIAYAHTKEMEEKYGKQKTVSNG